MREQFARGWTYQILVDLIRAFKSSEDPDVTLNQTDSCIEVAPYKHGKLFSMDNRRLYCLKGSFPALPDQNG